MPDDGLQFVDGDGVPTPKLNRKLLMVGKGSQINVITTYPGKMVYSTLTENGFDIDQIYVRNAANTAWSSPFTESSELNNTPTGVGTSIAIGNSSRRYAWFTIPTTHKLNVVAGIEWKVGNVGSVGNVQCGVDAVNADPPTINSSPLIAIGQEVALAASSATQRVSNISSSLIRGGTIVGVWFQPSNNTAQFLGDAGQPSQNQFRTIAYTGTPKFMDVGFTATTDRLYIKLYYRGYS